MSNVEGHLCIFCGGRIPAPTAEHDPIGADGIVQNWKCFPVDEGGCGASFSTHEVAHSFLLPVSARVAAANAISRRRARSDLYKAIRAEDSNGKTLKEIAAKHNLTPQRIHQIINRR